jgi:hypothetical protein
MKWTRRVRRNKENKWKYSFAGLKVANCLLAVGVFAYSETEGQEDMRSLCLTTVLFTQLILTLCVALVEASATILRIKTLYLLVSFTYLSHRELSIGLMIPMRLGLGELQPVIQHDRDLGQQQLNLPCRICLILLSILSLAVCMMTYKVRDSILKAGGTNLTSNVHTTERQRIIHIAMPAALEEMRRLVDKFCVICGENPAFVRVSLFYIVGDEKCASCRRYRLVEDYC